MHVSCKSLRLCSQTQHYHSAQNSWMVVWHEGQGSSCNGVPDRCLARRCFGWESALPPAVGTAQGAAAASGSTSIATLCCSRPTVGSCTLCARHGTRGGAAAGGAQAAAWPPQPAARWGPPISALRPRKALQSVEAMRQRV